MVDLWEYLLKREIPVELGSDQTSLHNPFAGGYYPAGLGFEEARQMMAGEPDRFKKAVQDSLCSQVRAINGLVE